MSLPIFTVNGSRAYPPRVSAFTETFWSGLSEGRFLTTCCNTCEHTSFPPKAHCPLCWSMQTRWRELSGRGRLYSYTVNHVTPRRLQDQAPYAVGIIDLDEGVRVFCRLIDQPTMHDIGKAIQMIVLQYADGPLFAARITSRTPSFTPFPVEAR